MNLFENSFDDLSLTLSTVINLLCEAIGGNDHDQPQGKSSSAHDYFNNKSEDKSIHILQSNIYMI